MAKLDFKIIRSRRRSSTTSISVSEKGVVVHAPFWIPKFVVDKFVAEKTDWIIEQLKKIDKKLGAKKQYAEGELEVLLAKVRAPKPKVWDGKWRVLVFDIPED